VPSGVSWAQGRVPTPKGAIDVAWKKGRDGRLTVAVSAPAGVRYTVGDAAAKTGTTTTTTEATR
jgi:hypothetical protein